MSYTLDDKRNVFTQLIQLFVLLSSQRAFTEVKFLKK